MTIFRRVSNPLCPNQRMSDAFLLLRLTVLVASVVYYIGIQSADSDIRRLTGNEEEYINIGKRNLRNIQNSQQQQQQQGGSKGVDFPYYIDSSSASLPQTASEYDNNPEICFIKCAHGSSVKNMDKADDPNNNVTRFQEANPSFRFYYFTNLDDLHPPGWTKIMLKDLPYNRYITHSRYGKFLAWRLPEIRKCQTVFYLDGQYQLDQSITTEEWKRLAKKVKESPVGLVQREHYYGIQREVHLIMKLKKDIPENMMKTMEFLQEQLPEEEIQQVTLYQNAFFGYDPSSKQYQTLSTQFWEKYSLEDGSWRDQILWAYMLHKLNMKPSEFLKTPKSTHMFVDNLDLRGHGRHSYTKENNADVKI